MVFDRRGHAHAGAVVFRELDRERRFKLVLVPTALAEFEHHSLATRAARHFLEQRAAWRIQSALVERPELERRIEWLAGQLRSKGYLPHLERGIP
jgi:hypothetical protein